MTSRGAAVPWGTREKTEGKKRTHDTGEITVELFDDRSETPRGHVEELPTPPHRASIPSRRGVFLDGGQVACRRVPDLELEEGTEIVWAGEEELEQATRRTHPFFF